MRAGLKDVASKGVRVEFAAALDAELARVRPAVFKIDPVVKAFPAHGAAGATTLFDQAELHWQGRPYRAAGGPRPTDPRRVRACSGSNEAPGRAYPHHGS